MSQEQSLQEQSLEDTAAARISARLQAALAPLSLEVIDESSKHAGHAHVMAHPGRAGQAGETHFRLRVVSEAFKGKSRLDRHRTINDLLLPELNAGVHALAIEAKAPGE